MSGVPGHTDGDRVVHDRRLRTQLYAWHVQKPEAVDDKTRPCHLCVCIEAKIALRNYHWLGKTLIVQTKGPTCTGKEGTEGM